MKHIRILHEPPRKRRFSPPDGVGVYPLPFEIVALMRQADLFTGELRAAVPETILTKLRAMGLADDASRCLTELGMAVRSWLFRGTETAPDEVSRLLSSAGRDPFDEGLTA